jgi:hypothetical protein
VRLDRSGTTLRSSPGERATLSPTTVTVPNGADGVTVRDLDIVGRPGALTVRLVGDRFTLQNDDITNLNRGRSCVLVGGGGVEASGGVIRGDVIHHCGEVGNRLDQGIYAQNFGPDGTGGIGLLIEGSSFFEIAGYAIQLYPRGVAAVNTDNVIDGGGVSVRGGIVIDGPVALRDVIARNVISHTRTGAVLQRTGSGHVARDNCFLDNPSDVTGTGILSVGNVGGPTAPVEHCPLTLTAAPRS